MTRRLSSFYYYYYRRRLHKSTRHYKKILLEVQNEGKKSERERQMYVGYTSCQRKMAGNDCLLKNI